MPNLSFDPESHVYTLDGEIIPSVSQIAAKVTGKDVSKIPAGVLDAARLRGLKIHKDVENGYRDTLEGQWISEQLKGTTWKHEQQTFGEMAGIKYAGTCDLLGIDSIGDIKTQAAIDLDFWTIQLNLYRHLFGNDKRLFVLWTPKDKPFKNIEIATLTDSEMAVVMNHWKTGAVLESDWRANPRPDAPSLDLIIYSRNVGELTTNAKAILETVRTQLDGYKADNYSESNIADAKRDKAELNAAAKKLNDKRLELERDFMRPFEEFKATVTETCNEIKKASSLIDGVVKEVEDREKQEKRKLIEDYFATLGCDLFELSHPAVWRVSWLNKTAKMKDIQTEITARVEKVKADLIVLDRIGEPEAKAHYLSTLNLENALAEADRIKANRERIAASEKARKAEIQPEEAPIPLMLNPEPPEAPAPVPEPVKTSTGEILERTMKVKGTYEQLKALGDYMNANGIDFDRV